jgi:hypothetical protein
MDLPSGICRVDQPRRRTHGYWVRLSHRKKTKSQFFADGINGGQAEALRKAVDAREAFLRELGAPDRARRRREVGVFRRSRGGRDYFAAWFFTNGAWRCLTFDIATFGESEAQRLAEAAIATCSAE